MTLRFRCEHCGKRLQVDQAPGAGVMCPYCRGTLVVPVDARAPSPFSAERAGWTEDPLEETVGGAVIPLVATYVPSWGTSVVFHLALVLISLATWSAFRQPAQIKYEARAYARKVRRFVQPPRAIDEKSRSPRRPRSQQHSSFAIKRTNNPIPDVANNLLDPVEVIGTAGGGNDYGGLPGMGNSRGPGGAGFFGVGGVAGKVVYVVDRSGSMTDSIIYVKHELKRSIGKLRPDQRFFVIFYSSGPPQMMPVRKLLPATEVNRQRAYEFIDQVVPFGRTDPDEALSEAFRLKPDMIYLLTDGEFDKGRETVGHIDRLNRGRKVTVNTIGFLYTADVAEEVLMKIADRNKGNYRYVGEGDLQPLK